MPYLRLILFPFAAAGWILPAVDLLSVFLDTSRAFFHRWLPCLSSILPFTPLSFVNPCFSLTPV
jgi:hypothetical protein